MLPGGRMEGSGDPKGELRREIKEDSGPEEFEIEGVFDVGMSLSGETFLVTYKTKIEGEPKVNISEEHTDYAWMDNDSIDLYKFRHDAVREKILTCLN